MQTALTCSSPASAGRPLAYGLSRAPIGFSRCPRGATGTCNQPAIPGTVSAVPPSITMLTPLTYRDPGQLPTARSSSSTPRASIYIHGSTAADSDALASHLHSFLSNQRR
jgi:hypothetical protein